MFNEQLIHAKKICDSNQSKQQLFLQYTRITTFLGFGYSFLFLSLGAYFTGLIDLITAFIFYPLIMFLNRKKYETSARLLLMTSGLIYIYSTIASIKFDIDAELYYAPVMILSLLLFDVRQKVAVGAGIGLTLSAWALGQWGPLPDIPVAWSPSIFPQEIFRNLNFIGSFIVTAIFLNQYRKHVLQAEKEVKGDLEKTQEVERNLQEAQRLAKLGNWELDIANNKLHWSDEIYRIFEIDQAQFGASYQAFLAIVHPEDRQEVDKKYSYSLMTRIPYEIVHRLLMPDGRIKFVREQCKTYYDQDLKPLRSIGTVQDISESYINDAKLRQSSKMAALGEMAGGIAHEINNPLTIIHGKSLLMLRKIEAGQFSKEDLITDLSKINTTINRISKIINGLRSISRNSESDAMTPTPVQKIIEDVLELSQERFKNNSVILKVDVGNTKLINCRSSEIEQVLLNLVNNSFDAVLSLDEKWVEIKTQDSGASVKIIVTDSGHGIEPAVIEKLMQPFFTTKEIGKGTGLGLSISKKIIEQHHGNLYYDKHSKNTSFVIEIPSEQSSSADFKLKAG